MRDDQAIERIVRPGFFAGLLEPLTRGHIVQDPAIVLSNRIDRSVAKTKAPDLDEEAQLEQRCRGDRQFVGGGEQLSCSTVILVDPDQRVGVEQDHRRFRDPDTGRGWNCS